MRNLTSLNLTFVLLAIGCDAGPGAEARPEFVRLADGGLVQLAVADEASGDAINPRQADSNPAPKPTKPWEPGSGYFVIDEDHPESESWYNTCADLSDYEDPFGTIVEIIADGATKTRTRYDVVTKVPESPVFIDMDGEPITVGKRLAVPGQRTFEFQGLYVDCTDSEPIVTDLRDWGYDAVLEQRSECHEFWDIGQNRFRVWYYHENTCTGEECSDPWIEEMSGGAPCSQTGMNVYKRIPSPFEG